MAATAAVHPTMPPTHTVLILSRDAEDYARRLDDLRGTELDVVVAGPSGELPEKAREATIAFGEPDRLAAALPNLPGVRWAQSTWAGLTPLRDIAAAGVEVTGVKGVFGGQMAEYVVAHLLDHVLDLPARRRARERGEWLDRPTGTLAGRSLGLMGTGSIGAEVARRAGVFDMRLLGYSRSGSERAPFETVFAADRLHDFLERSEFLVAVLPDTTETRNLLDAEALARLPAGALFINVGRGTVVDDEALVAALASGHLGGAVLDVFREEPLPAKHPFWTAPNLQITAHVAARSWPADIAAVFRDNLDRWRAGRPLRHRFDPARGY